MIMLHLQNCVYIHPSPEFRNIASVSIEFAKLLGFDRLGSCGAQFRRFRYVISVPNRWKVSAFVFVIKWLRSQDH